MKKKLAVVLSHPIQHFCPLYVSWARHDCWNLKVFFGSKAGSKPYFDENFRKPIRWDGLHLDEFTHEFLNGDREVRIDSNIDAPDLGLALERFSPDAVLTYGYAQRLQRRAKSWARNRGVPIIYFADSELRHRRNPFIRAVKRVLLPLYLRHVDWFLVTGNANEAYYLHYGVPPTKMIRSSYPIDLELYEDAWRRKEELAESVRAEHRISPDSVVVSMVGKLIDRKRQIDLIRALRQVRRRHITLLLLGTGEREETWRMAAKDVGDHSVIFAGFVDPGRLPAYYAASDIYAHTSEAEPHSVAVSEATFMGCPIVISHSCGSYGMDDDVQVGINGFVYSCGDVSQLAVLIEKLATDATLRAMLSEQSHRITARNQRVAHHEALGTLHRLLYA